MEKRPEHLPEDAVEDIDGIIARLRAQLIGEMRYGETYRLASVRGPGGIIVALAERLG